MKNSRVPAGIRPPRGGLRVPSLRLTSAAIAALAVAGAATISGQQKVLVPGQNINMVSGTTFPGGDPFLQKQNESSLAVSTRNPCHLLGGANDYRAVNLPGLPDDGEIGDAWIGLYKSTDCGQTWFSTLVPGYPQDTSAQGTASPVHGFTTGADPVIRSGPAGFFAYSFIAFNRSTGAGKLAVARFIDNNNKEAGDPIQYIDTRIFDSGSNGRFLDKPALAVSQGTGTCTIAGQPIPASTVHVAWTVFVGNDTTNRTKVYYARSSNCGATLDRPATKLSEGFPINQGTAIAVNPIDGSVYVAWRQFASDRTTSAILFAKSTDGGSTFTKAAEVPMGAFEPFDQGTTNVTFRTNAYPTMVFDHFGRLYLAVSTRGYAPPVATQTRVVVTTTTDGANWTVPALVDPDPSGTGHQIMPALTYGGGQLNLIWYDFRDDAAGDPAKLDPFIKEVYPIRHTVDVRGAQAPATATGSLNWSTYGVLQLGPETADRISQYPVGFYTGANSLSQLQHNPPNLRLYAGGTRPFFGDYLDVAGLPYVARRVSGGTQWVVNDGSVPTSGASTFHATWTDNRDARLGGQAVEQEGVEGAALGYQAPGAACTAPNLTETRNANVYTSRITPGLAVLAPGNAKPNASLDGTLIQRAFPVLLQNNTNVERTFRATIVNQDPSITASFTQFGVLLSVDVVIPRRSSATRTVYVSSTAASNRLPAVQVNVQEVGGDGLTGSTLLNPDIQNPDIQNPDIQNPDIQNPDIQNAEVHNPDIQNPDIQNPDIQNPDIQNPDIQNPDIQNPDIQNPDIQNPDIQNPDIQNPDIQNPDIQNPDIQNGSITDVSWDVTNEGNTTSGFQVKVNASGDTAQYVFQLIGRRVYKTPTANGCELTEQGQNQILFNIDNPDLDPLAGGLPDQNAPDRTNATVLLAPGETVKITLRAWDKDVLAGQGNGVTTPFCPFVDTDGATCPVATSSTTLIVAAEAANTGETEPEVATSGPDLTIASLTHAPAAPLAGAPLTFTAVVENVGSAVAPASTLLFAIGAEEPGAPGTFVAVPALAPGATFTAQRTAVLPVQAYLNTATADFPLGIAEIDESNNTATDAFTVTAPPPATFVVTTNADSGPGSLRQALLNANAAAPAADTITFSIPAGSVIALQTALPAITDPVTIDAAPAVVDCSFSAPPVQITLIGDDSGDGLVVNAPSTTIRGLSITNFPGAGIVLGGASNDVVACTYIGLSPDNTASGNGTGIRIAAGTGHTIGGATSASRNYISGNGGDGIFVAPASSGSLINGNYIGVDTTLTITIPNNGDGIQIVDSPNNTIGSANVAANVISGNIGEGVRIDGALATGNTVQGNFIGLSPSGQAAFGNAASGVYIRNAPGNTVVGNTISGNTGFAGVAICGVGSGCGGLDPPGVTLGNPANGNIVRGNRIGTNGGAIDTFVIGNAQRGVSLDGVTNNVVGGPTAADGNVIVGSGAVAAVVLFDNTTGSIVRGNYIGTDETGNANLPNDTPGVVILDGSNSVIGGLDATRTGPNVIRNNLGDGVQVVAGTNNKLRINRIDSNTGLAINLGVDGVTANDAGDGDAGPNGLQNAPVLSGAVLAAGTLTISGSLNSSPSTTFTIDFYASGTCDASGSGPGTQWIGAMTATTDGNGNVNWNTGFAGVPVTSGQIITALATAGDFISAPDSGPASTSEFSNCWTAGPPIIIGPPEQP